MVSRSSSAVSVTDLSACIDNVADSVTVRVVSGTAQFE